MEYTQYKKLANVTLGKQKADLVLKNLKLVDVFTGEIVESNVAVKDGLIAGVSRSYRGKKEIDLGGRYLAPGYIDAHLHLESTMVTPKELGLHGCKAWNDDVYCRPARGSKCERRGWH